MPENQITVAEAARKYPRGDDGRLPAGYYHEMFGNFFNTFNMPPNGPYPPSDITNDRDFHIWAIKHWGIRKGMVFKPGKVSAS
jgi:hypothetical protein